jgi:hypothetical protein
MQLAPTPPFQCFQALSLSPDCTGKRLSATTQCHRNETIMREGLEGESGKIDELSSSVALPKKISQSS